MTENPILFDQAVRDVLYSDGLEAVRRGFEPEVAEHGKRLLLQLLTLPSFESVVGWQIYQCNPVISRKQLPSDEAKTLFVGCRTEWLQEEDVKHFSSPVKSLKYLNRLAPTLRFQMVELDAGWLQSKLTELRAISISPFIESNTFGLDGERYEIMQKGFIMQSHFGWWCEGPEEWRPLTEIVFAMLEDLEDICAYDSALASGSEVIPFNQAIAEIEQRHG